ncbi:uncharacterized protein LOC128738418 isoform X2 [Sabethes cyaneus]|uniref:uncharacterized protein LOC128738418 isoform X2 n=1 Tax=Sabethes cyaneus TaxID=53552 RepID=UPI00237E2846|nr:uncharacterized protein LOC128738418 isoform X2 [Sabethes cyaneus]
MRMGNKTCSSQAYICTSRSSRYKQYTTSNELNAVEIMVHKVDFKSNPDYMKVFIKIRNGTDSQRSTVVDIDSQIFRDITSGVHVRLDVASKMGNEYRSLVNKDIDVCKLNASRSEDPLMRLLVGEIRKYGNMSVDCPLLTGNYVVRNFRVNRENMLIKLAPSGEYRLGIDVKHKVEQNKPAVPVFDLEFYATLVGDKP